MISVKVGKATEGYICYGHMVHWPKDDEKELEFAKPCKKTAETARMMDELKDAEHTKENSAKFQEWKNLKKVAMKDWSKDKSEDEGFKKNIRSVLEKILGDEHQQDDISIELTKDSWDKLKKGTLTRNDLRIFEIRKGFC